MADENKPAQWVETLDLIEVGEKVKGGPDGAVNRPTKQLDERTEYLKQELEALLINGLNVVGSLATYDDLEAIDTTDLPRGVGYFVEAQLMVWNGKEWISSGPLLGPRGITLLGTWPDGLDLPDVNSNAIGDAYVWKSDIWLLITIGTDKDSPREWTSIGLQGPEGRSAYQLAVDRGEKRPMDEWLDSLKAPSNYELWKKQGNTGTEVDYLATLKSVVPGPQGDSIEGPPGPSGKNLQVLGTVADEAGLQDKTKTDQAAYVTRDNGHLFVYVTDAGQWIDLGTFRGSNGTSIKLKGAVYKFSDLPTADLKEQDVYSVQETNTLYAWMDERWLNLGSFKGDQGEKGDSIEGPRGPQGNHVIITGSVATKDALPKSPKEQATYTARDTNTLYCFIEGEWVDLGQFHGRDGTNLIVTGSVETRADLPLDAAEQATYAVVDTSTIYTRIGANWVMMGRFKGDQGDKGEPGENIKGDPGVNGRNVTVKGIVAFVADLPTQTAKEQDVYGVRAENELYIYLDSKWESLGQFQGTDGKDGVSLVLKDSVTTKSKLPVDASDLDIYAVNDENAVYGFINKRWKLLGSFKGEPGLDGKDGTSLEVIKVLSAEDSELPPANGNSGKSYIDQDGVIWVSSGGQWRQAGPVGIPGDKGEQGTGIAVRGVVKNNLYLPNKGSAKEGDGWFTEEGKELYVLTDGEWVGPIDITGLQGEKGEPGKTGESGKSINIMGAYDTLQALSAAVPKGNLGDGYLVGKNLAIWTTADGGKWIDIGLVQGPPGPQGEPGPIGIGQRGLKGEKGASWITLPVGMDAPSQGFTGNIGDWAVSSTFKAYYKTAEKGWIYWGQLVAGDVNSPQLSVGKVVRLGNEWVPLLVDEAPEMIEGKLYVRSLVKGSTKNEGEWIELKFPDPFDDAPDDGKRYVRTTVKGSKKGAWSEVGFIIPEAPDDGKLYARQNPAGETEPGKWTAIPASAEELTVKDGKLFGRFYNSTSTKFEWKEIVIPSGIQDLTAKDGKQYARVFESGGTAPIWKEIVTIADLVTKDGKQYVRVYEPGGSAPIWKEVVIPAGIQDLVTKDGKQYARVYEPTGSGPIWKEIVSPVMARYDLAMLVITAEMDLSLSNVFKIANPSARTLTFKAGTTPAANRSMTVVLIIDGAGVITWPSNITWSGSTIPTLGATTTVITLLWDGNGNRWLGSAGATL